MALMFAMHAYLSACQPWGCRNDLQVRQSVSVVPQSHRPRIHVKRRMTERLLGELQSSSNPS
jgi:hypothetical protein